MTELTFVLVYPLDSKHDDDTMVLAVEERHVDTVIDAMQKQGWTLDQCFDFHTPRSDQ